jgi:pimeloyl-ACP methyl ester carboxylesterase
MESLTAAGQRIEYEFLGDGPLIVMVNIIHMPAASQHAMAAPLVRAGYGALVFENHGPDSKSIPEFADAVAGIIDQLDLHPLCLWGFSMGAMIVQELALTRPDLVPRMVLLATSGRTTRFQEMFFRAWRDALASESTAANAVATLFGLVLYSPAFLANDDAVASVANGAPSREAEMRAGSATERDLTHRLDELATISIPTLVFSFEQDLLFPPSLGEEFARAITGARHELIRGASHGGAWTHADQIAELAAPFLASAE